MAVIAAVFLTEKNLAHGPAVSRLVGAAVVALGVAVAIFPGLLAWVSGGVPAAAGM
jgi:predicted metal-binding membrane protein